MKVLKGTWAFRLKRTPDGVAYRHHFRFCIRDNQQEYRVNYLRLCPRGAMEHYQTSLNTYLNK